LKLRLASRTPRFAQNLMFGRRQIEQIDDRPASDGCSDYLRQKFGRFQSGERSGEIRSESQVFARRAVVLFAR
jgi:hypothetical protein